MDMRRGISSTDKVPFSTAPSIDEQLDAPNTTEIGEKRKLQLDDEFVPPADTNVDAKWIARQSVGRNYSSTSTVYMEATIKNPDRDQLLFCLATVIQAQIFEDVYRAEQYSAEFDIFSKSIPMKSSVSPPRSEWDDDDSSPSPSLLSAPVPAPAPTSAIAPSAADADADMSSTSTPCSSDTSVSTVFTFSTQQQQQLVSSSELAQQRFDSGTALYNSRIPGGKMPVAFHPEFNVNPVLSAEQGGESDNVNMVKIMKEAAEDYELREKLVGKVVPLVDTIFRYILYIQCSAKYPVECNLVALVYLNRAMSSQKHRLLLTYHNWRMVWTSLIILSQKVWDDNALRTSSFANILPSITPKQLRNFEMQLLQIIDYETGVTPSQYAQYYFEMRQLFNSIMGAGNRLADAEWRVKPLTIRGALILQDRMKQSLVPAGSKDKSKAQSSSSSISSSGGSTTSLSSISSASSSGTSSKGSSINNSSGSVSSSWTEITPLQPHGYPATSMSLDTSSLVNRSAPLGAGNIIGSSSIQSHRTPANPTKSISSGPTPGSTMQLNKTLEDITISDRSRFVLS